MEFSNVNGKRHAPEPALRGICDLCNGVMVSKCGPIRINHWAHLHTHNCDTWWENETEWHREWKRQFPENCREVCVTSSSGEKHRADVKTNTGRVIEFQHSPITIVERQKREAFYKDMTWVINALRLPSSKESFKKQLGKATVILNAPIKLNIPQGNCSILKTWANSNVDVYLDFGDTTFTVRHSSKPTLWRIYPGDQEYDLQISPVLRDEFIEAALNGNPVRGIHDQYIKMHKPPQRREPITTRPAREPGTHPERLNGETDLDYAQRIWSIDFDG